MKNGTNTVNENEEEIREEKKENPKADRHKIEVEEDTLKKVRKAVRATVIYFFHGEVEKIDPSEMADDEDYAHIEALDLYPNTRQYAGQWKEWPERFFLPLMDAIIDSLSLFYMTNVIAAGYPARYNEIMRFTARVMIPITATFSALNKMFEQKNFRFTIMPYWIWKAITSSVNLSAFLSQLIFLVTADIVRAQNHQPSRQPVYISDALAWTLIAGAMTFGFFEGTRNYYRLKAIRKKALQTFMNITQHYLIYEDQQYRAISVVEDNKPEVELGLTDEHHSLLRECLANVKKILHPIPSYAQRFLYQVGTNDIFCRTLGALVASSAVHNLLSEAQLLAGLPYGKPIEQGIRYVGALVAAPLGIIAFGAPEQPNAPKQRGFLARLQEKKAIRTIDFFVTLIRTITMLLLFYRNFFNDSQAAKKYGESTIIEQIILASILPPFIVLFQFLINCLYNKVYHDWGPSWESEFPSTATSTTTTPATSPRGHINLGAPSGLTIYSSSSVGNAEQSFPVENGFYGEEQASSPEEDGFYNVPLSTPAVSRNPVTADPDPISTATSPSATNPFVAPIPPRRSSRLTDPVRSLLTLPLPDSDQQSSSSNPHHIPRNVLPNVPNDLPEFGSPDPNENIFLSALGNSWLPGYSQSMKQDSPNQLSHFERHPSEPASYDDNFSADEDEETPFLSEGKKKEKEKGKTSQSTSLENPLPSRTSSSNDFLGLFHGFSRFSISSNSSTQSSSSPSFKGKEPLNPPPAYSPPHAKMGK